MAAGVGLGAGTGVGVEVAVVAITSIPTDHQYHLQVTIISWVGHRSPAKRICRIRDFAKYVSGRSLQFIVPKTVQSTEEKGSLWPPSKCQSEYWEGVVVKHIVHKFRNPGSQEIP